LANESDISVPLLYKRIAFSVFCIVLGYCFFSIYIVLYTVCW